MTERSEYAERQPSRRAFLRAAAVAHIVPMLPCSHGSMEDKLLQAIQGIRTSCGLLSPRQAPDPARLREAYMEQRGYWHLLKSHRTLLVTMLEQGKIPPNANANGTGRTPFSRGSRPAHPEPADGLADMRNIVDHMDICETLAQKAFTGALRYSALRAKAGKKPAAETASRNEAMQAPAHTPLETAYLSDETLHIFEMLKRGGPQRISPIERIIAGEAPPLFQSPAR